jgi:hypothetical protein
LEKAPKHHRRRRHRGATSPTKRATAALGLDIDVGRPPTVEASTAACLSTAGRSSSLNGSPAVTAATIVRCHGVTKSAAGLDSIFVGIPDAIERATGRLRPEFQWAR